MNLTEQHKNRGHGRLEEADVSSGTTYQELTLTKTLFEFYEKFYQKKPATGLEPKIFKQLVCAEKKKKNLAFDMLSCGLISRK